MEALIDAATEAGYPAEIVGVISNREDAVGLTVARSRNIPTSIIDHRGYVTRAGFEEKIDQQLSAWDADLVCLAGFMRIISPHLIDRWKNKIINIHPSMLPDYPGLNVHERVLRDRKQFSGCTVHFVREKVDFGPGIVQLVFQLATANPPQNIADRVLILKHLDLSASRATLLGGAIEVVDEKVIFKGQARLMSFSGRRFQPASTDRRKVQRASRKTDWHSEPIAKNARQLVCRKGRVRRPRCVVGPRLEWVAFAPTLCLDKEL